MKNESVSHTMSLKEISRKCMGRDKADLEGVPWFRRISYCLSDVLREIKMGFAAQVEYPLGKTIDR